MEWEKQTNRANVKGAKGIQKGIKVRQVLKCKDKKLEVDAEEMSQWKDRGERCGLNLKQGNLAYQQCFEGLVLGRPEEKHLDDCEHRP